MVSVRNVFDLSRDLGTVRRYFGDFYENNGDPRDLSENSSWWNLSSDQQGKLLRDYWRNNLVPRDVVLSQESNRVFASLERELEEPLLTSKKKRVLVSASRSEADGWHFQIPAKSYEIWTLLCWHPDYRLDDFIVPQKYYAQPFAQAKKAAKTDTIHVKVSKTDNKWNLEFVNLLNLERMGNATVAQAHEPELADISDLLGNYGPLQ